MLNYNGLELRNLIEQVQKNKDDIAKHYEIDRVIADWGIKVMGEVETYDDLLQISTADEEYGNAYKVNVPDGDYYIWTRANSIIGQNEDYWMNVGSLAIPGPEGSIGPEGPKGDKGDATKWYTGSTAPQQTSGVVEGDLYLNTVNGYLYKYINGDWNAIGTIRGPQGVQGIQGIQGPQGLQGLQGPKGDTGDVGGFVSIAGIVASTSQLPSPSSLNDLRKAYLVGTTQDNYLLYIQVGQSSDVAVWTNMGLLNVATYVTVNGQYQNIWDSDVKSNATNLENGSNDGSLQQKSFTYTGGDVTVGDITIPSGTEAPGGNATSVGAIALGVQSTASNAGSFATGGNTTSSGVVSFTANFGTKASGEMSSAFGDKSEASGKGSFSQGKTSKAFGMYSVALGSETEAGFEVTDETAVWGDQASYAEGYQTKALDRYTHAEGYDTFAGHEGTKTIEIDGVVRENYQYAEGAHAEGYKTMATNKGAHSEGNLTMAEGIGAHAEGSGSAHGEIFINKASGIGAHVEGYRTTATGEGAHAEGRLTLASGIGAHAEGTGTTYAGETFINEATGDASHVEGYKTTATNRASHAEGTETTASGYAAHAEGEKCRATNRGAHAEGELTLASGQYSHAEGYNTTASALASHAAGIGTKTSAQGQTVCGKYNVGKSNTLFEVGCGSSSNDPSNALEVYTDGRVSVKATPQADNDVVRKLELDALIARIEALENI